MPARVVQTERDQVLHTLPEHVGEIHRRAALLVPSNLRRWSRYAPPLNGVRGEALGGRVRGEAPA